MSDYQALRAFGHSAFKALEISVDARRGDFFARRWVAMARAFIR